MMPLREVLGYPGGGSKKQIKYLFRAEEKQGPPEGEF